MFEPTVGAAPVRTVFDLPGQSKRLLADPIGVSRVFVNGIETIVDGKLASAVPGVVLRAARDTTGPNLGMT